MVEDYNEKMIDSCLKAAEDMEFRVLYGDVIADVVYQADGSRILLTRTANNKYGYAVFEFGSDEPCYLVEGDYLIDDLQKRTDYYGRPLAYTGAKSMIEKNMVGIFYEYRKYPDSHDFYVSAKAPADSKIELEQIMAGYNPQYPVTLLSATFDTREFHFCALADVYFDPETEMQIIKLGSGSLKPDGTPDYDRMIRMEMEAQENRIYYGEKPITREEAEEIVKEETISAQSLLLPMYKTVGLPVLDGVEYCPLLADGLKGKDISIYLTSDGKLLTSDEDSIVK